MNGFNKMPTGIYKRKPCSEETKRKISLANALVKRKTGELASNWKGGKPKCIDCGKRLSIYHGKSKRCIQCNSKLHNGENHYNWQGGWKNKLPNCSECGKQLSTYNSKKCCEHKGLKGKNSPNWKGGAVSKRKLERNRFKVEMQKLVFERDDYACQLCGIRGVYLQVDHIQSWAEYVELRFSMDNCRTLCMGCHYKVTYGRPMPSHVKEWGHSLRGQLL